MREAHYFADDASKDSGEIFRSDNSLAAPPPRRINLDQLHSSALLESGLDVKLPVLLHTPRLGDHDLCMLLVYRGVSIAFVECHSPLNR